MVYLKKTISFLFIREDIHCVATSSGRTECKEFTLMNLIFSKILSLGDIFCPVSISLWITQCTGSHWKVILLIAVLKLESCAFLAATPPMHIPTKSDEFGFIHDSHTNTQFCSHGIGWQNNVLIYPCTWAHENYIPQNITSLPWCQKWQTH